MGVARGPRGLAAWGKVIRLASCKDRLRQDLSRALEGQSLGLSESEDLDERFPKLGLQVRNTVFFRTVSWLIGTRSKVETVHHFQGMGDFSDNDTCCFFTYEMFRMRQIESRVLCIVSNFGAQNKLLGNLVIIPISQVWNSIPFIAHRMMGCSGSI